MKRVKKTGKIIILTVLTAAALFYVLLPHVASVEQTIEIMATPDRIFALINCPENWVEWFTPVQDTSQVRIRFTGADAGKGSGMEWSANAPTPVMGIMNIRNSKNNRNVSAVVTVNNRRSSVMNFRIRPLGTDASTLTVTSRLRFQQDSLLHYLRLMLDRSYESNVVGYLENIDRIAIEKDNGIDVHLQHVDSFSYISIIDSCAMENVPQRIHELYSELLAFIAQSGISITARPITIYHQFNEKQVILESGIPVVDKIQVSGRVRYSTMPEREQVVAHYYGSYDSMEDGHNAIQHWLMRYRRKQAGFPWEMYVTEPASEPDSNKWLTQIYYPVN